MSPTGLLRLFRPLAALAAMAAGALASAQVTGGGVDFRGFEGIYRNPSTFWEPVVSTSPVKQLIGASQSGFVALKSDGSFAVLQNDSPEDVDFSLVKDRNRVIVGGYHFLSYVNGKVDGSSTGHGDKLFDKPVISMASGYHADGAVLSDGTVHLWGDNTEPRLSQPADLKDVKQLALGITHALALKQDGTLVTWGRGAQAVPKNLPEVVQVAAGNDFSLAVLANGRVALWGTADQSVVAGLQGVVQISICTDTPFGLALKSDGSVVGFGYDYQEHYMVVPAGLPPCISVACSGTKAGALCADGSVVTWEGKTGSLVAVTPQIVSPIRDIASGYNFAAALQYDGTVKCWGSNDKGQCVPPDGLVARDVVCGRYFAAALKTDGTVACWGDNSSGQCNVPAGLSNVTSLSAGISHVLALRRDGTVVGWGSTEYNKSVPPAGLSGVVCIAAGMDHSAVLKNDGTIVCWGNNVNGCCTPPTGLESCQSIYAGANITMALKANGAIAMWGAEPSGFPREGSRVSRLVLQGTGGAIAFLGTPGAGRVCGVAWDYFGPVAEFCILGNLPRLSLTVKNSLIKAGTSTVLNIAIPQPFGPDGALAKPEGETLTLSSDDPAVIVPSTITIDPSTRIVKVPIDTALVTKATVCTITLNAASDNRRLSVVVIPATSLGGISVNRTFVGGGSIVPLMGQVTLTEPATSPVTVTLYSSNAKVTVPVSVTVQAGFDRASFPIEHSQTDSKAVVTLTAAIKQVTRTCTLDLNPLLVVSLVPASTTLPSPVTINATVTLTSWTTFDREVTLTSDNPALVSVPASVIVPAGANSVTIKIKALKAVTTPTNVTVKATYRGSSKSSTLTLTPK